MFGAILAGVFVLAWSVAVSGFLGYLSAALVQSKFTTNY